MDLLLERDLQLLLADHRGPCVSLFLPTGGLGGGAAETARAGFRELLRRAAEDLAGSGDAKETMPAVLRPASWLLRDDVFWQHLSGGIAAFFSADLCRVFRLPLALPEHVAVGDSFSIKPLLPLLSGGSRFYLLALGSSEIAIWEGSERALRRLGRSELPRGLAAAVDDPDWHDLAAASDRLPRPGVDARYAHLAQLLAQVDAGVRDLLRARRDPLVLAAAEPLLPLYREINAYPHLVRRGIAHDPDGLAQDDLHQRAWHLAQPSFVADQRHAALLLGEMLGTGRASSDIAEVLPAARRGRIEVLFLAGEAELWGRFDGRQEVAVNAPARPGDEDLLAAAAAFTLKNGGTAYTVGAGEVPGGGALAAAFRP